MCVCLPVDIYYVCLCIAEAEELVDRKRGAGLVGVAGRGQLFWLDG